MGSQGTKKLLAYIKGKTGPELTFFLEKEVHAISEGVTGDQEKGLPPQ